jgi:radical SAM superfamily enzyme YgiQ (UPF0313 family)
MGGKQFVLTADRSLMSHYRDNMLYGFTACFPSEKFHPFMYKVVFCPSVPHDKTTGEAHAAPCGLRRVEGGLIEGFGKNNVFVSEPGYIEKPIGKDTKVVGLNVMDAIGIGPVPSALTQGSLTPINRLSFKNLCLQIKRLKEKYGFKVVVGGPGAWQLAKDQNMRKEYGVDHIVVGEADKKIVGIYNDIMDGKAQEIIFTRTDTIEEVPYIPGPTCNGVIEAMRGCGRGCDFCDPNMRRKRDFPIERLKEEASTNLKAGIRSIWLQSEEILLYGLDNHEMRPNKDAVIELFREMTSMPNVWFVGTIHLTFSSAMAEPVCVEKLSEFNRYNQNFWGGIQTGLETASAKLIKRHMPWKVKPYSPEEWPRLVRDGIKLLNDNYIFALNTMIIGLPGEDDDDVRESIDLVKSLKGSATIISPMMYTDYNNAANTLTASKMTKLQWELYHRCWVHNAYVVSDWIWYGTAEFNPLFRMMATVFTKLGAWYALRIIRDAAKKDLGIYLDY